MYPFPSHPYLGQLHITDSLLYRWNGVTWDRLRIGAKTKAPQATPSPLPSTELQALELRIREIEQALETGLLLLE